jgi:hypothetical protein
MLILFMYSCSTLQPFGILDGHLVYFVVIWYIFPRLGMSYQEKSGNPAFLVKKIKCHLMRLRNKIGARKLRERKKVFIPFPTLLIYVGVVHTYMDYTYAPNF